MGVFNSKLTNAPVYDMRTPPSTDWDKQVDPYWNERLNEMDQSTDQAWGQYGRGINDPALLAAKAKNRKKLTAERAAQDYQAAQGAKQIGPIPQYTPSAFSTLASPFLMGAGLQLGGPAMSGAWSGLKSLWNDPVGTAKNMVPDWLPAWSGSTGFDPAWADIASQAVAAPDYYEMASQTPQMAQNVWDVLGGIL